MPCAGNAESQLNGFPLRLEYVLSALGKLKERAEMVMVINEGTDAAAHYRVCCKSCACCYKSGYGRQ